MKLHFFGTNYLDPKFYFFRLEETLSSKNDECEKLSKQIENLSTELKDVQNNLANQVIEGFMDLEGVTNWFQKFYMIYVLSIKNL